MTVSEWCVDTRLADFDLDGVRECLSSYPALELDGLINSLNLAIWSGFSGEFKEAHRDALRIARNEICVHALYLLQFACAKERAQNGLRRIVGSRENFGNLFNYLDTGQLPEKYRSSPLLVGPPVTDPWRGAGRFLKSALEANKIYRLPRICFWSDYLAMVTARAPLVDCWIEERGRETILWEPNWYFKAPRPVGIQNLLGEVVGPVSRLIQFVVKAQERLGIGLNDEEFSWLERQWGPLLAAVLYHLGQLQQRSHLPRHFISASVGSVWDQMMRINVRSRGGEVTTFEHGSGLGMHGSASNFLADFHCSNRHICFNEESIARIRSSFEEQGINGLSLPLLSCCKTLNLECNPKYGSLSSGTPKVLFAPMVIAGERARNGAIPSDIVTLDFTAKIIGELDRIGYKVIIKPHPSDLGPGCRVFEEKLGHQCSEESFEQELMNAGLIVTAAPSSTTVIAAIESGIPTIVIDPRLPPISSAGLEYLKRKTSYFSVIYDKNELLSIDWKEFAKAASRFVTKNLEAC